MEKLFSRIALHVSEEQMLERSRWYGPNLVTFITTGAETGDAFSLLKCTLRKGFEPPLHVHSREEESYMILDGEVVYKAGDETFHAKPGSFVHLPRMMPHSFKLITETATLLLIITPSGFEQLFKHFSRPALALTMPPIPTEMPGHSFFDTMNRLNAELGVTMM